MATTTTHYNLAIYEGDDYFNPLVHENGNAEKIDEQMYKNQLATAGGATELVAGTVHSITRTNNAVPLFHFTATGRWALGDTMTVDGVQVTVLTAAGTPLTDGSYVIGSEVFGYIRDTLVTIINTSGGGSGDVDADTLEGHPASYFATAQQVTDLDNQKANNSVGISVQLTTGGWTASSGKYTQSVAATGVTASNNIIVSPAPNYRDSYSDNKVFATAQTANRITFTADTKPTQAMYVNVVILG